MKRIAKLLALAWLSAAPAWAGPVQKAEIDGDAKWLLHLDLDQFRSTKLGGYLISQVLEKRIRGPLNELKDKFHFEADPNKILEKIGSITIYGTDYTSPKENAVLMIKADADLQAAFVGVLAGLSLAGTNSPVEMKQTQLGKVTLYSENDKIHCAVLPGKMVVLTASRNAAEKAAAVLNGKSASLESKGAFAGFAKEGKPFFFLGMAEGFNGDMAFPPQARLLQMADGGQIVLGEGADVLFLDLALKAKTPEVVTQMQQVIQGLIAMTSLAQPANKDLAQLIQTTQVSASKNVITVSMQCPADKVIQKIDETEAARMKKRTRTGPPPPAEGKAE